VGYGQALIAITWRKSLPDLPKLAQITLQPANGHALDYELGSLPYALHNAFGDAAIPYLETMLERSEYIRVRTNAAQELILGSRPKGFAFAGDAIENNRSYRQEMIQFIRDRFPELRQADEPSMLKFVQARAVAN
jgi:glycine/D-amino acid oxidase-like deaminating enzyme